MEMPQIKQFIACKNAKTATVKPFCEIKNITDTTADLYFYGDIVSDWWGAWQEEDQYPDAIKNFLAEANGRDLNIYINSGGGSVFAGIAIYNMLKRYKQRYGEQAVVSILKPDYVPVNEIPEQERGNYAIVERLDDKGKSKQYAKIEIYDKRYTTRLDDLDVSGLSYFPENIVT